MPGSTHNARQGRDCRYAEKDQRERHADAGIEREITEQIVEGDLPRSSSTYRYRQDGGYARYEKDRQIVDGVMGWRYGQEYKECGDDLGDLDQHRFPCRDGEALQELFVEEPVEEERHRVEKSQRGPCVGHQFRKLQGEAAWNKKNEREYGKRDDAAESVPENGMKNVEHFYAVVFLKNVDFITVAADTSGKEKVVEHAEVVELQVIQRGEIDADIPKKTVEAQGVDDFRDIEKYECQQEIPGVRSPDDFQQFGRIDFRQNKVEGQDGNQKLNKGFEKLRYVLLTVCQRFF